jgi:hypothetical protein
MHTDQEKNSMIRDAKARKLRGGHLRGKKIGKPEVDRETLIRDKLFTIGRWT